MELSKCSTRENCCTARSQIGGLKISWSVMASAGRSTATSDAKEKIRACSICSNITDSDPCLYCVGPTRSKKTICVVEEAHNIMAIEKTRTYTGMYHVLGGSLSPLSGRGPEQLHIKSLIERLKGASVEEIIIATNPTAEGEATTV